VCSELASFIKSYIDKRKDVCSRTQNHPSAAKQAELAQSLFHSDRIPKAKNTTRVPTRRNEICRLALCSGDPAVGLAIQNANKSPKLPRVRPLVFAPEVPWETTAFRH
jgi:hypothetical protein